MLVRESQQYFHTLKYLLQFARIFEEYNKS